MGIKIRNAIEKDIPQLVKIWREMWDFHAELDKRFTATAIANEVMTKWMEENLHNERALLLVAEDSEVVGYLTAFILENPPVVSAQFYGLISEIAITEKFRRNGIGGLLLNEAHKWLKERNASYVEVNVSVLNTISCQFWRKYGYKEFLERLRFEL